MDFGAGHGQIQKSMYLWRDPDKNRPWPTSIQGPPSRIHPPQNAACLARMCLEPLCRIAPVAIGLDGFAC